MIESTDLDTMLIEIMTGKPPSLRTPEADAVRVELQRDCDKIIQSGGVVDLPFDIQFKDDYDYGDGSLPPVPAVRGALPAPKTAAAACALQAWLVTNTGLSRTFTFADRRICASFLSDVLLDANVHNHHPDTVVDKDSVHVVWVTHQAGDTITDLDYEAAIRTDTIAERYGEPRTAIGNSNSGRYPRGSGLKPRKQTTSPGGNAPRPTEGTMWTKTAFPNEPSSTYGRRWTKYKMVASGEHTASFNVDVEMGVFKDTGFTKERGEKFIQNMLSVASKFGGPEEYQVMVSNKEGNLGVRITGNNMVMDRDVSNEGNVHHDIFRVSASRRGEGIATRMLAESLESYVKQGFTSVRTTANLNDGKYSWARLGFKASQPDTFRDTFSDVLNHAEAHGTITGPRSRQLKDMMREAGEDAPKVMADQPEGKELFLGSLDWSWQGYLNLKSPEGRAATKYVRQKANVKKVPTKRVEPKTTITYPSS